MSTNNPLEHAEHISHAGHEGHGGAADHEAHSKLGTYIGITMAVLGVILAYCAAKVGAERTELVQALVEQQDAHAKYLAQDVKHRVSVSNLRQLHSAIPMADLVEKLEADLKKIDDAAAGKPPALAVKPEAAAPKPDAAAHAAGGEGAAEVAATTAAARALGKNLFAHVSPNKEDGKALVKTVHRYKDEADAAKAWMETFDPEIKAHVEAQESYELAQLLAEIGIVIASVALLIKRRAPWFVALALGVGALVTVGKTYASTTHEVDEAKAKIEETDKVYREMRAEHKKSQGDDELLVDVCKWAGCTMPAAPSPHGAEKPAHHE